MDITNLKIAVVGAGYGGAAVAKGLSLQGADVAVYEQATEIHEVGAGIGLRPSTMDLFRRWGIFDAIAKVSSASDYFEILTATGDPIAKDSWPGMDDYEMKTHTHLIHRGDFIDALTGVPIFTHLAVDVEPALAVFAEEGLPLDRVLFGHADDGVSQGRVNEKAILGGGGRIGFDTFGYDLELPDPPFWGRHRRERLEHFLRLIGEGHLDQVLASADANCSPLGWPGVKGHTVNYIYEQLLPDLRQEGIDEATIHRIFVENPADFLTLAPN